MTKDYRRPSVSPRRRTSSRGTCAFWFLFGGVLGAFGVGYAWMIHEPASPTALSEEATTRPAPSPAPERTFDFYSLLPEEEVVVPAEDDAPTTPALPSPASAQTPSQSAPQSAPQSASRPTPTPTQGTSQSAAATPTPAASAGGGDYLLQLGSFRSTADAERLKAQLALKGIQTSIQTVTIDNGQTYHRVRTAALDKAQAQAMRSKLQGQGQESMMVRTR
jgi:cell division protein FtsN